MGLPWDAGFRNAFGIAAARSHSGFVPRTYPPVPEPDDLYRLAMAALANARELLDDARLLAQAGSFPRAHAPAIFAAEEHGKSQLCLLALTLHSTGRLDQDKFWAQFRNHKPKLTRLSAFDLLLKPPTGSLARYVSQGTPPQLRRGAQASSAQPVR